MSAPQARSCRDLRAVVQRHAFKRLLKERRAAAGDQENHLVLRGHAIRQRQRRPCRRHAGLVRNRVGGLVDGHARDIALAVAVFGDDNALAEVLPQRLCRRVRHAPRGLSDGDHGDGAVKTPPFQRAVNGGIGQSAARIESSMMRFASSVICMTTSLFWIIVEKKANSVQNAGAHARPYGDGSTMMQLLFSERCKGRASRARYWNFCKISDLLFYCHLLFCG